MTSRKAKLTVVLASFAVVLFAATTQAALVHRYSFSETGGAGTTLVDSVGGQDGTIVDPGGGPDGSAVGGGQVTLAGGTRATAEYVALPAGLVNTFTEFTIETWATQKSNTGGQSRIFDFGLRSAVDFLFMSWTRGGGLDEDQVAIRDGVAGASGILDDTMAPYTLNQEFHIALTVDDDGGTAGNSLISVYKDGVLKGTLDTAHHLTNISFVNNFIGRSQFDDPTANASYNEFRIYNTELSSEEVEASFLAGPNPNPVPEPSSIALAAFLALTVLSLPRRRRATM